MKLKNILSVLLICSLFFSGCSNKKNQDKNASNSEQAKTAQIAENENSNDNYGGKGDRIKKVEILNTEKKNIKKIQNFINTDENMINKYFLSSELSGWQNISPEDVEIGALYSGEKEYKEIASFIIDFFDELKKNNVKEEQIEEDKRFYLGKIFSEYVKNNHIPDSIRVGLPLISGDIQTVNLRFIKNSGKTEGEIVIIRKKEGFLIKGFNGDLSVLDSEVSKGITKFEPEIYKFN